MPPESTKIIRATFPNEATFIPVAQSLAREAALRVGFEGSALSQIEVAVEEAVSNVQQHAYDAEENSTYDLICELTPAALKIVIREHGIPFDPERIPKFKGVQDSDVTSTAGMGVFFMRSFMDECTFHNLGPEGKETRLVKYLRNQTGVEQPAAEVHAAAEPEAIIEKIECHVRPTREDETIEVSKCAFKSHGYSFFDDHIYYPERLVELIRSGDMISAVAVTKEEVFMGHACLLFQYPEDRCAELTFAFVNPEFRGQGALGRLLEALFEVKSRRPLEGLYAYAVANHPITQKSNMRYGINDCGILLATSPASWKFKGIPGDANQRISVVLAFRYIGSPKKLTIYPPAHHREIVAKLYRNIGANHEFAAQAEPPELTGESEILTGTNQSEGCAEIFIRRYGKEIVREVRRLLRGFCLQQYAAINLFLNIEAPATYYLTSEFEKLGFFFAGILPCTRIGDVLMLQYLNNVDVDYGKITAYSDIAKETLAYIRAHDPNLVD